jgi:hypothetical protein
VSAQAVPARPLSAPGRTGRAVPRPTARPVGRGGGATARTTARAAARPAPRAPGQDAPGLRVVSRPELAPRRLGFALTCTALLTTLMLGLLLLNVAISGNAFTLAELQQERGVLAERQQALQQQVHLASAPDALADAAQRLGMTPAPHPVVLSPDGTGAPPVETDD